MKKEEEMTQQMKRDSMREPLSNSTLKIISIIFPLILFAAVVLQAQTPTASVSGIVSDPSGAVVPGVTVTVTDIERGEPFSTQTNASGVYFIKDLNPSTYKISAAASGFHTYVVDSFPLIAKQDAVLNITLQMGSVSQTIEVKSQVQMVEPSNATLSGYVQSKEIVELPLSNREVLTLMALEPGVAPSTPNSFNSTLFIYTNRFTVNGGQEDASDVELDGFPIVNQSDLSGIMAMSLLPTVDAIGGMKVQTNAYSAAYGRSGGGIATMVTKSGTNAFHGSAFEFLQNTSLIAGNFFSNRSGAKVSPLHQDQYGASLGGPVIKNKTFFFADYERLLSHVGAFTLFTVPTAAERLGDFSENYDPAGQLIQLYNPFSTAPNPSIPGTDIRTPIPGNNLNNIPGHSMDPVALKAISYYPMPNLPGTPIPGTSLHTPANNAGLSGTPSSPQQQLIVRADQYFSGNKRGFLRYGYFGNTAQGANQGLGYINYYHTAGDPDFGVQTTQVHNGVFGYTQVLGPTTVLDLRLGSNSFRDERPTFADGFDITTLGFPAALAQYMNVASVPIFPTFTIPGYSPLGPVEGSYYMTSNYNYIGSVNLSRVMGKHTLTMGGEARAYFLDFYQTVGVMANFGPDFTQGPNPLTVSPAAGDAIASFLLGTGDSGTANYVARTANANHYYAQFLQDDIKWTRKLTINVGIRLEEETATTERHNRMTAISLSALNPISNEVANPATGQSPWNVYGGYVYAGSGPDSLGRRALRGLEWKPSPRLGFAYSLNDKTVIRAGYGMIYGVPHDSATDAFTGGAFGAMGGGLNQWVASLDGITPNVTLQNAWPSNLAAYALPAGSSQGLLTSLGTTLSSAAPSSIKCPYNQQWNVSVQRSLSTNTLLQLAYVGNKATHLSIWTLGSTPSLNQLPLAYERLGQSLLTLVPNPFAGKLPAGGALNLPTVKAGQLMLPYPEWQGVMENQASLGNSEYEALQVSLQKRYANGITLESSYTRSKLMDDVTDGTWTDYPYMLYGEIRSWYCLRCEHTPSAYDVPNRFTVSAVGELPFGRGKRWGSSFSPVENQILGGWQANMILTLGSGQPLIFVNNTNNTYSFGGGQHPDLVGNPVLPKGQQSVYEWFNTAAFAQPADFTFGNLSRTETAVRTDWTRNVDFSLSKNFNIVEKAQLQFRAEAYNLFNTPIMAGPNTTLGAPGFGTVGGQSNMPRAFQFGLKLLF
jgi:hypothetical protein